MFCRVQPIVLLAMLSSVLGACGNHRAAQVATSSAPVGQPDVQASANASPSEPAVGARAAPAVRITGAAANGEVAISVQNRAAQAVEIAPTLGVERRADDGYRALSGVQVALSSGESKVDGERCVAMAPGAELQPAPWAHAQAGTYRFVARGCDGSYRIDGEPFEVR